MQIEIPNGKCVAHQLTICFPDGSMTGVEIAISARVLVNKNGTIVLEEIQETDISVADFLNKYPNMTIYFYGSIHIIDELRYIDMNVAPCAFKTVKHIFPELAEINLPIESYFDNVYDTMRDTMLREKWDDQTIVKELGDWLPRYDR